jgi:hypothetical protein
MNSLHNLNTSGMHARRPSSLGRSAGEVGCAGACISAVAIANKPNSGLAILVRTGNLHPSIICAIRRAHIG